ncbi:hypothetical protein C3L33_13273, partial [Rhododendron williamsianum]
MEIDLELPSVQEDKLDTVSDVNIGHATDVLLVVEEEVNSPTTRNGAKGLGLNAGKNISRSGEGVDEDALGVDTSGKESKSYEPQRGLEFESKEEAYSFYREYARSVGFGITIKASRRSKKSGKFIDVKIACSRFGSKPDSCTAVNSRSCPKTDSIKLGEEGSLSQERYNIVIDALQEAMEHCVGVNTSVRSVLEPNMSATQGFISTEEENQSDSFAKASKKKKIHKKRKVQSETEVIASLVQDCNLQMGMLDSGAHIVDNTCVPQQHMPGMGHIHSSSLIHNGYYSNQQGTQGMGQSNSIATRIGHYGPQQSLQGLLQGPLGFRAPTIHGYFNIQDSLHDVEQSVGSRQFHDVRSKRLHDKHLLRASRWIKASPPFNAFTVSLSKKSLRFKFMGLVPEIWRSMEIINLDDRRISIDNDIDRKKEPKPPYEGT